MKKSSIQPMPQFFDRYINIIEDIDIFEAFVKYTPAQVYKRTGELQALGDRVYAPGKWTVKDILQHVVDNERIMAYRALRFSRGDKTALAGYEEELLAANTLAATRSIPDLMNEFELVRAATIPLFENMSQSMLLNAGTANEAQITPLALGFVILGHPVHHMRIIEERYFPLL